ncbi:MAG: TolC family protein [Akkermansiaceae bacterium]|nr:TolC family protein [Verrucomicrobiales bacterium]
MRMLLFAGLLIFALAAPAADPVEDAIRARQEERLALRERVLSLEDCIKLALEHNLEVQITRLDPQLAQFELSGSYASYDPALSLSASHSYDRSPGGRDSQNRPFTGAESETDSFSAGIGGLMPWGLSYNLGATASERDGTQPTTFPDFGNPLSVVTNQYYDFVANAPVTELITNYASVPGRFAFQNANANVGVFQLRQPLLRNFWTDATRLQIDLNKRNLKISILGFRSQVITTITAVEQAYYDLIYAEESVKVQEKALELAERLVAENRRRVEVGALAPLDEKQAESQAAASRADLLATKASRDTQQRVLKILLSDDYDDWKTVIIRPMETLQAVPQPLNLQESWRRGMASRPDLLQARLGLENQAKILTYQRNQTFPQLDLVGDVGYTGSDDEFSSAFRQVRDRDNLYYSYGAQLTIPLGNVGARNSLKSAKTTKEQLELQLEQLEQNVLVSIENSLATARTSLERVEATRQARLYAEEALKAEQMKLEKGKSTSFIVLQLQRDLTSARSAEIRALADYNISLARLALNEGSTLERRGVELNLK